MSRQQLIFLSANLRRVAMTWVWVLWIGTTAASGKDLVPWVEDLGTASQQAEAKKQLILLHFWDANCPPCKRIEKNIFSEATFAHSVSQNYVPVKVKVSQNPDLARHFKIEAWPTDVIVTPQGEEVYRTVSPQQQSAYVNMLDQVVWRYQSRPEGAAAQFASTAALPLQRASTGQGPTSNFTLPENPRTAPRTDGPMPLESRQFQSQTYFDPQAYAQASGTPMLSGPAAAGVPTSATMPAAAMPSTALSATAAVPASAVATSPNVAVHPESQLPSNSTAHVADRFVAAYETEDTTAVVRPPHMVQNPFVGGATVSAANNPVAVRTSHEETGAAPSLSAASGDSVAPSNDAFSLTPPQNGASVASQRPGFQMPSAANDLASVAISTPKAATPPQQPTPSSSPAGATMPATFGMDGYCTVSLVEQGQWTAGDKRWGAHHRGRTYLFHSAEAQQKFLAAPDRYSPALAGFDPVVFSEQAEYREGKREHGVLYQNQIFLFSSEESLSRFWQAPRQYANTVHQAMGTRETQFR